VSTGASTKIALGAGLEYAAPLDRAVETFDGARSCAR
jgi:hypothetical protein